jgi:peptidoglycan biosynthesis protein MviN/MurJ (putative lipid II flippase)
MAFVVNWLSYDFSTWVVMSFIQQVQHLVVCITVGCLSYFASVMLLGIRMVDFKVAKS